ncbi:PRC-barrel domain-containing protein [Melittangium boletus]|uniref:Photosystem reaction center subunit H n=1 Tax=Melittangium boletus DSM 14713 TaxID=1294270 RepID=A0A250IBG3_9BACT|nr:PRC-barrel domain-containing protein [Melittangium boletus]ATB28477.1 photosystem reaction center subunit H [Melittangium boletus DSM 14713]
MKSSSIATALVCLMATTAAQAQQAAQQQEGKQAQPPTTTEPHSIAGGALLGVEVRELTLIATGYRASKILGDTVYNDKNERIGRLEDLIIKPDGTVSYAILEVGGFLGMGTHRVAIPVGQFTGVKPRITLPGATKDTLKKMPEFTYAKGQ